MPFLSITNYHELTHVLGQMLGHYPTHRLKSQRFQLVIVEDWRLTQSAVNPPLREFPDPQVKYREFSRLRGPIRAIWLNHNIESMYISCKFPPH